MLAVAAAKVGKDDIRTLREEKGTRYDEKTGLPIYSLDDLDGNSLSKASKLLTGKPLMKEEVFPVGDNPKEGIKNVSELWQDMQKDIPPGELVRKGVVTFRTDKVPHARVWLNSSNATGTFGNPWEEQGAKKRGEGKIFDTSLLKALRAGFIPNNGTVQANDRYFNRTVRPTWRQRNLVQDSSKNRSRLGNINHISNTDDTNSDL